MDTLVPRFWWWYGCERRHGGKTGKERGSGQGRDSIPLWKNRKRLLPTLVRLVRKMWGRSVGGGRGGRDGRVWNFFQPAPHVPLPKVQGQEFTGMGPVKATPPTLHPNSRSVTFAFSIGSLTTSISFPRFTYTGSHDHLPFRRTRIHPIGCCPVGQAFGLSLDLDVSLHSTSYWVRRTLSESTAWAADTCIMNSLSLRV